MITSVKEFENKVLLPHELNRIQPLQEQASSNGIEFKFFSTVNYHYRNTNHKKVAEDNERIRYVLRKVFGCNIRFFFFIERHTNPEEKCFGGYHKHILIEQIPAQCWHQPTSSLQNFMLKVAPEMVFAGRFNQEPHQHHQNALVTLVVRSLCKNVPNGILGMYTEAVTNTAGALVYCTKQFNMHKFGKLHKWYEVLDTKNSDCDARTLLDRYDSHKHQTRYEKVLA